MKATHRRRELRKRQKLTRQNVQAADPPQPPGESASVVGPGMLARTPSLPRLGPQRAPLEVGRIGSSIRPRHNSDVGEAASTSHPAAWIIVGMDLGYLNTPRFRLYLPPADYVNDISLSYL